MRFVLGLLFLALALTINAKTIKGTVIDDITNEPLIGATVEVEGTATGTATDFDGSFEIECNDGSRLVFKYVAYETVVMPASDGMTARLRPSQQALSEVTVTAQSRRDVDAALLRQWKASMTVNSGVSAQQISRTQDRDASEVMRRVPGISIIDDKFVMVRGLAQRYNNVWINGSAVPSSEADSRAFSFDIIPASQLDNITIVKAPAPEYPADFCGGFILVNTKNIPEKNAFSITLGGNINEKTHFRNFSSAKGSATDFLGFDNGFRNFNGGMDGVLNKSANGVSLSGNGFNNDWLISQSTPVSDLSISANLNRFHRFDNGSKFGLLAALNYNLSHRTLLNMENSLFGAYDVENDCENYLRRSVDNQFTQNARLGAMLNLVWLSADGCHKVELKNIFNQLGKDRYTYRKGISAQSDPEIRAEYFYSSRSTYNGQLAGTHRLGDNNFDWAAGYSYADRNMPDRRRYLLSDDEKDGRYSLLTGNDVTREYTLLKEHIASAAVNYNRTFSGKISPTLKAGAYAEYRTRDYRTRSFIYAWNPSQNNLPADFRYSDIPTLLSNEAYYGDDGLYLIEEVKWRNNYSGNNTLAAAYASVNIPLGKVDLYAGLRFEHSRMELISNTRDYERSETSNFYDTNDFFPSLNVAYRLTDQHQMRMAYGRTINRQEFREVSSSVYYDFDLAGNVQGNPDLEACRIDNVDLRYEWYPSDNEIVSVALFGKFFNKPIEWTYTVAGGTDLVYSYKNADNAYSFGLELDVRKNLAFIGAPWLSLIFNGALIKSHVEFAADDLDRSRPMQGQSPYLINTGLFYTHPDCNFNASLLYNRIGKRIIGVGRSMGHADDAVRIPDSYEMPRNTLDFSLSQRFAKHFEVKLSIKDILGEKVMYKQFEDGVKLADGTVKDVEEVTRSFTPGRNYSLSLTYNF